MRLNPGGSLSHRPGVDDDDDKAAIGVDTLDGPESLKLKITAELENVTDMTDISV